MHAEYTPSLLFKNGHFNTVYPSLFRKQSAAYSRERISTPDGDFLDLDFLKKGFGRCALLFHGLEGNSSSHYMIAASKLLHQNDWDVCCVNFRGCSGEDNLLAKAYHSGATEDVDIVLNSFSESYGELGLIGFSLGGNMILKYAGEKGKALDSKITSVIGVSVPSDLKAGSLQIDKPSNWIYKNRFLVSLKEKMKLKSVSFPNLVDLKAMDKARSLFEFDDVVTAQIHGFTGAEDYYKSCSANKFIPEIKVDSLIISAVDDPFLPQPCYPYALVKQNALVQLLTPKYGGHVGFAEFGEEFYWIEKEILNFINKKSAT